MRLADKASRGTIRAVLAPCKKRINAGGSGMQRPSNAAGLSPRAAQLENLLTKRRERKLNRQLRGHIVRVENRIDLDQVQRP